MPGNVNLHINIGFSGHPFIKTPHEKSLCFTETDRKKLKSLPTFINNPSIKRFVLQTDIFKTHVPLFPSGGFEYQLGKSHQLVGMALQVTEKDNSFAKIKALEKALFSPKQQAERGQAQSWQAIDTFLSSRSQKKSILNKSAQEIWLEFDINKQKKLSAPNVFFKLEPEFARPPSLGPRAKPGQKKTLDTISEGLAKLSRPQNKKNTNNLQDCIAHLPASASITYIGAMLARPNSPIRITLGNFPLIELIPFLNRIRCDYDKNKLIPLLSLLEKHTPRAVIHLDIQESPLPNLGFEISFHGQKNEAEKLHDFLIDLKAMGLCTNNDSEMIQAWPTKIHKLSNSSQWPETVNEKYNYFTRSINHLKLTYRPQMNDQPVLTAKAYLAYNFSSAFPHPKLW